MRLAATTQALADGLREAAGRPARSRSSHTTGLLTVFFAAEPPTRLRGRRRLRHRGLRRLVPRAARPRRLPAAVAVRGLVPVARPHAASTSPAPLEAAAAAFAEIGMSALDGARAPSSRAEGGLLAGALTGTTAGRRAPRRGRRAGRARRRRRRLRAARRGDPRGLPAALRRPGASCARTTRTSRCWPATGSTRSGSTGWPSSATSRRSPSSPTDLAGRPGAGRGRSRTMPTPSGRPGARAVAHGPSPDHEAAKAAWRGARRSRRGAVAPS